MILDCMMGSAAAIYEEALLMARHAPDILTCFFRQWSKHVLEQRYKSIDDFVQEVQQKAGQEKVNIAGYSLGGLAALAYAMENPDNVAKCVTIGAPVKGTPAAYYLFSLLGMGIIPATAAQMLPESRFITALGKYFAAHNGTFMEKGIVFENIRSMHDLLAPYLLSSLKELCPDAWNITEHTLKWKGHIGLLHDNLTCRALANIAAYSDYPTIFLHGFGLGERSFGLLLEKMRKECPDAANADNFSRLFMAPYDYTEPIMAQKIMKEYDEQK